MTAVSGNLNTARHNIRVQRGVAVLSVALLLAKMVAYYLTNSVAVLTDALESIVNVVAGFFGLYSLMLSAKPKDLDHPYGHGKIEFISAAVEGSMIFIAGILIIYESVRNLITPHSILQLDIGIVLILVSALTNFGVGYVCIRTGKKNNSLALIVSGKHLQTDTYTSFGILVGLILIYFTRINWLDSVVAMIFSVIILVTGYKIIRTSVAGIMDESDRSLLSKMVDVLNKNRRENWIDLHNLRIIKYGSTLHMDCHLTVPWYLNVKEAHDEMDVLANLVRQEFDQSIELFVHADACLDYSCKICSKKVCPVRKHSQEKNVTWTVENIIRDKKHSVRT